MAELGDLKASVVVLTHNEGDRLARAMHALLSQKTASPFEVLIVDSNSTDGSTANLGDPRIRRITIPHESFNHGEARNIGARMARGELVVFLVADAVPIADRWLQALIDAMDAHPGAVGGLGRQRAWPDADPDLSRRIGAWTPPGPRVVRKRILSKAEYWGLDALERIRLSAIDNVNSVVRREYLVEHPFPSVEFGEDIVWGQQQLLAGQVLLYIPVAEVWHSHRRSLWHDFNRARIEHQILRDAFGYKSIPHVGSLARQIAGLMLKGARKGSDGLGRQWAELLGQCAASWRL